MAVSHIDADWNHLFPEFRIRLQAVLQETETKTGEPWILFEGYRSPERQLWLYAQGRTRPGRVVTHMKTPKYHGTGLAGDCYPKARMFSAPQSYFETYRKVYHAHGLTNPAWVDSDRGHCQLSDPAIRLKALAWVRAGFPAAADVPPPEPPPEVHVFVDGQSVDDADAYIDNGHVVVALRPIADAFDWSIARTWKDGGNWKGEIVSDNLDQTLSLMMKGDKGYVWASQLPVAVSFDGKTKSLRLSLK